MIGSCASELHTHLCPYCNVWPEAVYCLTTLYIVLVIMEFYQCAKLCMVFEMRELKLKKKNNNNNNNENKEIKNSENELFYNFNNFPIIRFWSFFEDPHILTIGTLL